MQNNVTELTQKLLRSLDSNYNVIDMPAVIEIISLLEKIVITKELLETTRLGKHVNELRRNTTNESLAKRAKELVKKWRSMVLPDANTNGQVKQSSSDQEDGAKKKRPPKDRLENATTKKTRLNGQSSELDFSDNSNSSFKDVILKAEPKRDVILINSDSNSSMPDVKHEPHLEQQLPKKRGRKKGSKNHRNLLDEAETSFTNKMAVSRGNAKVKTTQELVASLQNKSTSLGVAITKPIEDLNERAAKLTERVSIIDQKLNTNANRYKAQRKNAVKSLGDKEKVFESGSVSNVRNDKSEDDEIIVVDDIEPEISEEKETEEEKIAVEEPVNVVTSLSVEEALAQLPPVDTSALEEDTPDAFCTCCLMEHKTDFSIEEDADVNTEHRFEFVDDPNCPAKTYLQIKYSLGCVTDDRVYRLHNECIPNVNGNYSVGPPKKPPETTEDGLYANVVPNINTEHIPKDFSCENYKKYNFSKSTDDTDGDTICELSTDRNSNLTSEKSDSGTTETRQTFSEWHEVVEATSYNDEILKILPYVIID